MAHTHFGIYVTQTNGSLENTDRPMLGFQWPCPTSCEAIRSGVIDYVTTGGVHVHVHLVSTT